MDLSIILFYFMLINDELTPYLLWKCCVKSFIMLVKELKIERITRHCIQNYEIEKKKKNVKTKNF